MMHPDNALRRHAPFPDLERDPPMGPPGPLPQWDALNHLLFRPTPDNYPAKVEKLRKPLSWFFQRGAEIFYKIFLRDPTFIKFLSYGWHEVVDLIGDQAVRNRALTAAGLPSAQLAPYCHRRFLRDFYQQPCTRETTERRVTVCEKLAAKDSPVLLLGDDDMVSVEMARRGFTDVTVVDIDMSVLETVQREAARYGVTVKTRQHDFNLPAPAELQRPYALVTFDPIYSIAGIDIFLRAARELTGGRPGTQYFMSVHLMSLLSDGMPKLQALFDKYNIKPYEYDQGFNIYPLPAHVRLLVAIVNIFLMHSSTLSTRLFTFPYIFSDAFLLRQE